MSKYPDWVKNYIGIRFKSHGRDADKGVDCWGLIVEIYENEYDVNLPLYNDGYDSADNKNQVGIKMRKSVSREVSKGDWERVNIDKIKCGDVLLMDMLGIRCHIGIAVNENEVLHIRRGIHSHIENFRSNSFAGNVREAYRYKG